MRAVILWFLAFALAQVVWLSFACHVAREAFPVVRADYQRCISIHEPLGPPKKPVLYPNNSELS